MHNTYTKITSELAKYFKETALERAVIGVSGGIDSAVCLKLTVDAIGKDRTTALLLPEKGVTSEENIAHARTLTKFLEVETHTIYINSYLSDYVTIPWKPSPLATTNTKSRIRMTLLYHYANSHKALVIGTSNKSELAVGYGTKYGDLGVDIDIIGDLLKEDVYRLGEHLSLPDEFLTKPPSAELYTDQTDEEELGLTYREIDQILKMIEQGHSKEDIINKGMDSHKVHKVFRLMKDNRHKLVTPYIIPVKTRDENSSLYRKISTNTFWSS